MSETPVLPENATQNTDEQITTNEERNNNETLHAIDFCASLSLCSKIFRKFIFGNDLKTKLVQIATTLNSRNNIDTEIANIFIRIFNDINSQLQSNL